MFNGIQKRNEFLQNLLAIDNDAKVHYVNKYSEPNSLWNKEKLLKDLTEDEIKECNLRKIQQHEILLDLEEAGRLVDIEKKLKEKNWNYQIWFTGSRGYHIILYFNELKKYSLDKRNRIRKYIIREFSCDESKSSERTWMALEWTPHFKTSNLKVLTKNVNGYTTNIFNPSFIKYIESQIELERLKVCKPEDNFKNFIKEDPYLKWVITHEIGHGGRNNVLFKNMAVAFVKAGLIKDDIQEIAKQIIKNCPGKNLSEFMGWVSKAIKGEISEYNKFEIVKWGQQKDIPVMYKLQDDKGLLDSYSVKDLWNLIWKMEIAEQPVWKELCFYNMMGTILDERQDDLRAHIVFISPTSSGKDLGINLIQEVLNKMEFTTYTPSEITDKTLVGGINEELIKYNSKYGLMSELDEYKDHTYKNPIDNGVLSYAHWLGMAEAQAVFKPGAHNQGIQRIFRQAMDKKRVIEKGVGAHMITCNTNTSFILASYPQPEILNKLHATGLFQRVFFYYRNLSKEESRNIRIKKNEKKFNPDIENNYDKENYLNLLVKKLKKIKLWYNEHNVKLYPNMHKDVNFEEDYLEEKYQYLQDSDYEIIQSMLRRAPIIRSFIYLNAIKDMRERVNKSDVKLAYGLFDICLDSIRSLLLLDNSSTKKSIILRQIVRKKGKVSATELRNLLREKANIKSPTAYKKFVELEIAKNNIIEVREGRNIFLISVN